MSLIEKAARIAHEAHVDQVRKNDGSPYVIHPVVVAMMLAAHGFDEDVIAAGLVHDVLEDASELKARVRDELGEEVFNIVSLISEDKTLPWRKRKEAYVCMLKKAPKEVKAVSVADKIHNLESLVGSLEEEGETVWSRFTRGKEEQIWFHEALYDAYQSGWDHKLVREYKQVLDRFVELAE